MASSLTPEEEAAALSIVRQRLAALVAARYDQGGSGSPVPAWRGPRLPFLEELPRELLGPIVDVLQSFQPPGDPMQQSLTNYRVGRIFRGDPLA